MEQKCFDLRLLSSALCNLWLLLVIILSFKMSYNKLIQNRGGHISGERGLIIGCIFCLQVNRTITGGGANNRQDAACAMIG